MSYAGDRIIFDADSHLMELPDFLTRHADAEFANQIPPLSSMGDFDFTKHADMREHPPEVVAELTKLGDNLTRGPKWHDALGAFNGAERTTALDLLGFQRQVVFSSFCGRLILKRKRGVRAAHPQRQGRCKCTFRCDQSRQ